MKIIIIGCGKVGFALAAQLNTEGHDITLIDKSAGRLQPLLSALDVQGLVGNGTNYRTLQEAGVEDADLLIAVTNQDEINMLCCLIAKKTGRCHTIARVRDPEYVKEIAYLRQCLDISLAINPELAAAREIAHLIQIPAAMDVDTFAKGRVDLIRVAISDNSPIHSMSVQAFSKRFNHEILICTLERDHQISIPNGNTKLHSGDVISVIMPKEKIHEFYRATKLADLRGVHDVILAGGGTISYYLAQRLVESGIHVTIIEIDKERCDFLSLALPKVTIIHGDATDNKLLLEEGLANADAFVALTNLDEANVFISLYANKVNKKCKKITKINRLALDEIIEDLPIGSVISPKHITTENILQYVRSQMNSYGSNVEALYQLMGGEVEALEFLVGENSQVTNIPLMDLHLKENLLVCCIVRNNQVITPSGRDTIQTGDTVIVVTTHKGLQDISDILGSK